VTASLVQNGLLNQMKTSPVESTALPDFFRIIAVAFVATLSGCGKSAPAFVATSDVKTAVAGNNAFAVALYQDLKDQSGNLIFSPFSISSGSAMTYAGARGQTGTEMAGALHFTLPQEKLHVAFGSLAARLDQVQRWNRVTLTTANSLWCQKDYPFSQKFLDLIGQRYFAEAQLVDFKSAESARTKINSWIQRKTKEKISSAIAPDQFTPNTKLVLCNAIYFKGKWENPFDEKNTKPGPFYLTPPESVTVPMMVRQKARFKATTIDDLALLELPYAGNDLSMIVLLPDAVDGLPEVEHKLTTDNLSRWIDQLVQSPQHELAVLLPRFKTTQSLDLKKELSALGVSALFSQTDADLSGMTGKPDLYISDAVHKAFIEVNESGTEAAAGTWLQAKTMGMRSSFRADHPFIFLIRENQTGSILFLGRMVDPTK
jgi:serine protease inhibitor